MKRSIIFLGILILLFSVLITQLGRYSGRNGALAMEWMVLLTAVGLFILLLRIGLQLSKKKKNVHFSGASSAEISRREQEILLLISDGRSNQEIAQQLYLSESTVKKHISNLFVKLDVKRRTEAVKVGRDRGLI